MSGQIQFAGCVDSPLASKKQLRADLEEQMERWLRAGRRIQQIPMGVSGEPKDGKGPKHLYGLESGKKRIAILMGNR